MHALKYLKVWHLTISLTLHLYYIYTYFRFTTLVLNQYMEDILLNLVRRSHLIIIIITNLYFIAFDTRPRNLMQQRHRAAVL